MTSGNKHFLPLDRETSPGLESTFQAAETFYGYLPNYFLAMSRLPAAVEAYTTFLTELYDEVTLPSGLAQLISLEASSVSGCTYSIAHSAMKASQVGVANNKIAAIGHYQTSPLYNGRERAALEFANKSAQAPSPLDQIDFDNMNVHFSETEICEIVFIVALTGFHNRWNDSVATELETDPLSYANHNLPADLWQLSKHQ